MPTCQLLNVPQSFTGFFYGWKVTMEIPICGMIRSGEASYPRGLRKIRPPKREGIRIQVVFKASPCCFCLLNFTGVTPQRGVELGELVVDS